VAEEKYPLDDLLRVRKFREEEAAAAAVRSRQQLEAARELVEQRSLALEKHIQYRMQREQ